jgi:CMP/dCMP kinase
MQRPRRIANDGPAGSGKSTVGEQLAARLGYLYIDTGAMYRAVTWLALKLGIDINDGSALAQLAQDAEIVVSRPHIEDGRQYTVTVRGHDATWDIRDAPVTHAVSTVSAHPDVRAILIAQQRALALMQQDSGVVMVGRDIGAVVLPDAELKIYLTANPQERARRRHAELVELLGQQNPALPSLEDVLTDIERRDAIDRDNMQPASDAIIIATDHLSVPQVIEIIYKHLEGLL